MVRPLLLLALLCSQAACLVGPGMVRCRDRAGRVTLEWAGHPCPHCHAGDPVRPADAPPAAEQGCDCEHVPLTDGSPPAPPVARPAAPDLFAAALLPASFDGLLVAAPAGVPLQPPPDPSVPSHLALLAAGLRC